MKIRKAEFTDALRLAEIGETMHRESAFASMEYSRDHTADYIIRLIGHDGRGIEYWLSVVENDDGAVVGGMIGYVTKTWFGPDKTASDIALFILPEYRGGMAAVRLIKAYLNWAASCGAKQIRPGVSTGETGSGAERLYEKLGLKRVGSIFCLEVI